MISILGLFLSFPPFYTITSCSFAGTVRWEIGCVSIAGKCSVDETLPTLKVFLLVFINFISEKLQMNKCGQRTLIFNHFNNILQFLIQSLCKWIFILLYLFTNTLRKLFFPSLSRWADAFLSSDFHFKSQYFVCFSKQVKVLQSPSGQVKLSTFLRSTGQVEHS